MNHKPKRSILAGTAILAAPITTAVLTCSLSVDVHAQSCNPRAVYPNPDTLMPGVTRQAWAGQPCRDPWINIAYASALGVKPTGSYDQGECWPGNYLQGRWSNYNGLLHSIARYRQCMRARGLTVVPESINDRNGLLAFVIVDANGQPVGNDSASLVAQGGGTLVSRSRIGVSSYRLNSLPNLMNLCSS